MALKYPFRILIDTVLGKKESYYTASFIPTDAAGSDLVLSASDAWNKITGSTSCSYQNQYIFSESSPGDNFHATKTFKDSIFISSSVSGSNHTGSILFHVLPSTGGDKLKRVKFFGNKVCNVLGIDENIWHKPQQLKMSSTAENNFLKSDIIADTLFVRDNFIVSNVGGVSSDLPFRIPKTEDRWIKFINVTGSVFPHVDLRFGYNAIDDIYELSASDHYDSNAGATTFNIGGVNELRANSINVTHFTSSYITSSVTQIFTEITSSGNSIFGDANTDNHRFLGNVGIMGGGASSISHSVDGLTVEGDISASGNLYLENAKFIYQKNSSGINIRIASLYANDNLYFGITAPGIKTTLLGDGAGIYLSGSRVGIETGFDGDNPIPKTLTVQGDISASGDIFATDVVIGPSGTTKATNMELTVQGDISASGDIFLQTGQALRFTGSIGNQYIKFGDTDFVASGQIYYSHLKDEMHLLTGQYERLIISQSGGVTSADTVVGIGTSTPPKTLTVEGSISASGDVYFGTNDASSSYYFARNRAVSPYVRFIAGHSDRNQAEGFEFYTRDFYGIDVTNFPGGGRPALRISSSGVSTVDYLATFQFGTPEAGPDANIIVQGDISASGNIYVRTGQDPSTVGIVSIGNNVAGGIDGIAVQGDISASGNVFIGDYEGGSKLYIHKFSSGAPNAIIQAGELSAGPGPIGISFLYRMGNGGADEAMTISGSTGYVQIGGGAPDPNVPKTLTVQGDISASGDLDVVNISGSGNLVLGGGTFTSASLAAGGGGGSFSFPTTQTISSSAELVIEKSGSFGDNLTVAGDISASGNLYLQTNKDIYFDNSLRAYIGASNANLYIASDNDIRFAPDDDIYIAHGIISSLNTYVRFDGDNKSVHIGTGSFVTTDTPKTLTVAGDISASGGQWLQGNLALGNSAASHSVDGLTVAGDISASGTITAEHIISSDDLTVTDTISANSVEVSEGGFVGDGTSNISGINNITVSGNISASGGIFVETGSSIGTRIPKTSDKGMFTVNYGTGAQMTGSLSSVGDAYGDVVGCIATSSGPMQVGGIVHMDSIGQWAMCNCVGNHKESMAGMYIGPDYNVLLRGFAKIWPLSGSAATITGQIVYISETLGSGSVDIPSGSSGNIIKILGNIITASDGGPIMYFNPDNTWVEMA